MSVPEGFTPKFETPASKLEVRCFLALGGPPRRQGWTLLGKLMCLDIGRGPGTRFERILDQAVPLGLFWADPGDLWAPKKMNRRPPESAGLGSLIWLAYGRGASGLPAIFLKITNFS